MRVIAVLLTGIVMTCPVLAQSPPASPAAESSSHGKDGAHLSLPVSVDKIQEQLSRPPALSLRSINETAADQALYFRMQVQEHQKIQELMSTLDFKSGPAVPGGLYAAEIQRLTHGSID